VLSFYPLDSKERIGNMSYKQFDKHVYVLDSDETLVQEIYMLHLPLTGYDWLHVHVNSWIQTEEAQYSPSFVSIILFRTNCWLLMLVAVT
jgi:hypothetical protein